MDNNYKISGTIVTYCGADEAILAINSVIENTNKDDFKLFVVDNNSPDGTGEIISQTFLGQNKVDVLRLCDNIGFGGGHNAVIERLESDYHAVINPDITLGEDTLQILCNYLEQHKDVVMITPRLLFPDGKHQYVAKRRPTFRRLLARQLPFKFLKKYENEYLMLDKDLDLPQDIEFCTGSFFVMRTEIFKKIGGFDEGYFMYVEDGDITKKAAEQGRVLYYPETYVYHAWHRNPSRDSKHFFMQLKSMFRYFKKWGFKF